MVDAFLKCASVRSRSFVPLIVGAVIKPARIDTRDTMRRRRTSFRLLYAVKTRYICGTEYTRFVATPIDKGAALFSSELRAALRLVPSTEWHLRARRAVVALFRSHACVAGRATLL
ncbi:hypothetical protein MRX96_016256 [Rhipicephalus microplus]